MAYVYCSAGLVVNPDNTLTCDNWEIRTELEIVQDAGLLLTQADFALLKDGILLLFAIAFGIKMIRGLLETDPGRN